MSEKLVKKRVCVTLAEPYLDALDRLVREGVYVERSEAIKDALRRLFRHYEIPLIGEEGIEEDLQEVRWRVAKAMLDEFPKLRERVRRYLEEEKPQRG